MSAQTTSISRTPGASRRPSISSRLSFAVSSAEQGEAAGPHRSTTAAAAAEPQIDEEIAEIKRYEVRVCSPIQTTALDYCKAR